MWIPDSRTGRSIALILATAGSVFLLLFARAPDATAMQAMSVISGQVVDLEGEGVPDATIRIADPDRGFSREVQTREDGSFTLRTIPPGAYTIIVEKEGYEPYRGEVTLQAGSEMRDVEVTLAEPTPEAEAAPLFQQGIESYNAGDIEAAIEAFEQVAEMLPDSFEAHANLGQAYLGAGRYEDAVASLERAVKLHPGATQTKLRLSLTYSHLGRYDEAEAVLEDLLGEDPDLADPLIFQATVDLGNVYFASNRPEDAAEVFEEALEVQPESPAALLGLGKCRLQRERFDEALELFEQVVAVAPDSAEAQEARSFIDALSGG